MYIVVRASEKEEFTAADGKRIGQNMIGAMLRAGYSRPRCVCITAHRSTVSFALFA
jgi:TRAP-type C4-dicarboxylate transport system permease large subunit